MHCGRREAHSGGGVGGGDGGIGSASVITEAEKEDDAKLDKEVRRIFEHAAETITWLEKANALIQAARSDDGASGLGAAEKSAGHLQSVCQSLLTVLLAGEVPGTDTEYGDSGGAQTTSRAPPPCLPKHVPDQSLVLCLLHHFDNATREAAAEFPSANDVVRTKQDVFNQQEREKEVGICGGSCMQ